MDAGIEASRALIESILSRKIDTSDKLLKALHKSKTGESTSDEDEENEPHAWISNDAGWTALHAAACACYSLRLHLLATTSLTRVLRHWRQRSRRGFAATLGRSLVLARRHWHGKCISAAPWDL